MKDKKRNYDYGYYEGSLTIEYNGQEYEVECSATGNIYFSTYEDGFTESEIDGVIPCITKIYKFDNKDDVTQTFKDNEDFLEVVEQKLVELFNDGYDDWVNEDARRRELEEENRLYWLCEMAEKDYE